VHAERAHALGEHSGDPRVVGHDLQGAGGTDGIIDDLLVAQQHPIEFRTGKRPHPGWQTVWVGEAGGAVAELGVTDAAVGAVETIAPDLVLARAADQRFALSVDLDLIGPGRAAASVRLPGQAIAQRLKLASRPGRAKPSWSRRGECRTCWRRQPRPTAGPPRAPRSRARPARPRDAGGLRQRPAIRSTVPGFATDTQIASSVAAISIGWPPTAIVSTARLARGSMRTATTSSAAASTR
jgi:hypothetical protein